MRFQGSKCNLICTLLHHFDSCTTWSCTKNGTQKNTSSMSYILLASRTFSIIHFERLQWANYYNFWTWMSECFGHFFWGGFPYNHHHFGVTNWLRLDPENSSDPKRLAPLGHNAARTIAWYGQKSSTGRLQRHGLVMSQSYLAPVEDMIHRVPYDSWFKLVVLKRICTGG